MRYIAGDRQPNARMLLTSRRTRIAWIVVPAAFNQNATQRGLNSLSQSHILDQLSNENAQKEDKSLIQRLGIAFRQTAK